MPFPKRVHDKLHFKLAYNVCIKEKEKFIINNKRWMIDKQTDWTYPKNSNLKREHLVSTDMKGLFELRNLFVRLSIPAIGPILFSRRLNDQLRESHENVYHGHLAVVATDALRVRTYNIRHTYTYKHIYYHATSTSSFNVRMAIFISTTVEGRT